MGPGEVLFVILIVVISFCCCKGGCCYGKRERENSIRTSYLLSEYNILVLYSKRKALFFFYNLKCCLSYLEAQLLESTQHSETSVAQTTQQTEGDSNLGRFETEEQQSTSDIRALFTKDEDKSWLRSCWDMVCKFLRPQPRNKIPVKELPEAEEDLAAHPVKRLVFCHLGRYIKLLHKKQLPVVPIQRHTVQGACLCQYVMKQLEGLGNRTSRPPENPLQSHRAHHTPYKM